MLHLATVPSLCLSFLEQPEPVGLFNLRIKIRSYTMNHPYGIDMARFHL